MTEEKKKNRGWVKNAIIIFLLVMLLLTFFSNTIMNRSLPEVAVQTAQGGTIQSQIRGTGTVTAAESYEVILQEARTVQSVAITAGQEVAPGDLLFTLSASGSGSELDTAREQLESLRLEYQRALINASEFDYAKENRDIQRLREQLEDAILKRDSLAVSDKEYADAQSALNAAKTQETIAQAKVDKAQQDLESVTAGGSGDYSVVTAAETALSAAKSALSAAQTALATAQLRYGADYKALEAEALEWIKIDFTQEKIAEDYDPNNKVTVEGQPNPNDRWNQLNAEQQEAEYQRVYNAQMPVYLPAKAAQYSDSGDGKNYLYVAYTEITKANGDVASAQAEVNTAQNAYNSAYNEYINSSNSSSLYNQYKKALSDAQSELTTYQERRQTAETALTELNDKKSKYETEADNVKTLENSVEDALFNLAQQQKSDNKTKELEALDLKAKRDAIAKQEELVEKLSGSGTTGNEIYAQVYGVVKSVNITAGNTTTPGTALASIEVPDMGYRMEMTVTVEQSRKVQIGEAATISNNYWWGTQDISAKLVNIRTDPKAPQQNKILVFEVTGADVESGSQLTLSLGLPSKTYETVVPNSAVRSDANGSFVYIVVAKSSPIGNRYMAQRVDVQVVEKDDNNSAISGAVAAGDYVITTSTAPVESGMYVKMPEA